MQPPLPESFERPGDFFKYVLCEVSTPGKAPAIQNHCQNKKDASPQIAGASNRKVQRQETEDRKALILKRAEELYRKKKRIVKNRLVGEMAECTNRQQSVKEVKTSNHKTRWKGTQTRKVESQNTTEVEI